MLRHLPAPVPAWGCDFLAPVAGSAVRTMRTNPCGHGIGPRHDGASARLTYARHGMDQRWSHSLSEASLQLTSQPTHGSCRGGCKMRWEPRWPCLMEQSTDRRGCPRSSRVTMPDGTVRGEVRNNGGVSNPETCPDSDQEPSSADPLLETAVPRHRPPKDLSKYAWLSMGAALSLIHI